MSIIANAWLGFLSWFTCMRHKGSKFSFPSMRWLKIVDYIFLLEFELSRHFCYISEQSKIDCIHRTCPWVAFEVLMIDLRMTFLTWLDILKNIKTDDKCDFDMIPFVVTSGWLNFNFAVHCGPPDQWNHKIKRQWPHHLGRFVIRNYTFGRSYTWKYWNFVSWRENNVYWRHAIWWFSYVRSLSRARIKESFQKIYGENNWINQRWKGI